MTFHLDHVIPPDSGGETALVNLALSCPGCNMSKANRTRGLDVSGNERDLINPRSYEPWLLGWHLHFALERQTGRIVPLTPTGEATISTLDMNSQRRSFARKLQIAAGLIS